MVNPSDTVAITVIIGLAVVVTVLLWQIFKTAQIHMQAEAEVTRDQAYRKLAEQVTAAQERIASDLDDLRKRVAAIEQVLKEVE